MYLVTDPPSTVLGTEHAQFLLVFWLNFLAVSYFKITTMIFFVPCACPTAREDIVSVPFLLVEWNEWMLGSAVGCTVYP